MQRRMYTLITVLTVFFGFAIFPAAAKAGTTYYIDFANGSNSNSGTSTSAPWKTHPYMQVGAACTGSGKAPAYSHVAGDRFIFKGGVTWPAACFMMTVSASGNPVRLIITGLTTHGPGGGWSRPVFDLQNQSPTRWEQHRADCVRGWVHRI